MEVVMPDRPKKELTTYIILLILVTCLGSVHWGFNLWLVNDPITLKQYFHNLTTQVVEKSQDTQMHPALFVFTVAAYLLGCLLGSLLFAPLADKYGRKAALMVNDVFTIVTTVIVAVSKSYNAHGFYALARFLTGVGTGIFSCAIPIYLGEISPANLRGGITIVNIFFVSLGVMVSQILGGREFLGNPKGLPFLRSIPGIISLFQFFLLHPFLESPGYLLIQKRNENGARQALRKLRNENDVEDEIEELREEDQYEKKEKGMSALKLLLSHRQRWQVVCVVTLIATQQFSGINAIWKIDSWGRRPLLLLGFGICIVSCVLLTMSLELQVTFSWMTYVSSFLLFIFTTGIVLGPTGFYYILKAAPETKKKTNLDIRKLLEAFLARKYLNEMPKATRKPEAR